MTQPTVQSFFSSSKGRTAKWPKIGSTVSGTILVIHPPDQQSNPAGELMTWKDGEPRMQVRIELQTEERNPEIEFDDGRRMVYVKADLRISMMEALRKAGVTEPEIGGKLTMTCTGEKPNIGVPPTKLFTDGVEYVKPASGAAAFFNGGSASAPGPIAQMPAAHMAGALAAMGELVKPEKIPQVAWDAMDEATRQAVVNLNDAPPF